MTSARDVIKCLSIWSVHWSLMTSNTGRIIFLLWYMPTIVRKNATDFSPYYLMYRCKPRLPIDIKFALMSPKTKEHSHNNFVARLSAQLWKCYKLANRHKHKEFGHHKWQYDWKMRVSRLKPGDLCLVWHKAFTGKHKIEDHWQNTKYVVVEWQCNLPVYTIKLWQGDGQTLVVHRNLLMHIAPTHQQEGIQSGSEY